jgi:arginyl-tRNA--protein-N-Asp/Glu arginylyltransferase
MTSANTDQTFVRFDASPAEMDQFWADGWRHFGVLFFRYRTVVHDIEKFTVLPLRVDLDRFTLTRSQKRVFAKNLDSKMFIRPACVDAAKDALFLKHRRRFKENVPSSLDDFLSPYPDSIPCLNLELCFYLGDRLVGVTFLDVGETATSAVYAMFDPTETRRSLGILMMLQSIQLSRERGCRYYYPGYAYREPSVYDYKKRFAGEEYLDWATGWKPYPSERNGTEQSAG